MRGPITLLIALVLAGCGGGGGGGSNPPPPTGGIVPPNTGGTGGYTTSQPLIDNSGATAYKVLLMGNSHASGLMPVLEQLLLLGQPTKSIEVRLSHDPGWLADRVNDGFSEQMLESDSWTHVVLQGQKYSTTGVVEYPTTAAQYWIRGAKLQGATSILFPEHPRQGNDWEGQALWDLHSEIATRENSCVAPVGLTWDEVIFRDPTLALHLPDGNHADDAGLLLTALVFYPIITGESVDTLPGLGSFGIDAATEQIMKSSVSSLLFTYQACRYEG